MLKCSSKAFFIAAFATTAAAQNPTFVETQFRGAPAPRFITNADFNNDGYDDIVVANTVNGTVTVLWGNPHGGFTPGPTSPSILPQYMDVADLNLDGSADLFVASGFGAVLTEINNGSGLFTITGVGPSGSGLVRVAAGDVNNDGKPDAVAAVSPLFSGELHVYIGDGLGQITGPTIIPAVLGTRAVRLADMNHDGNLDAMTSNGSANSMARFTGFGNGGFGNIISFAVGAKPDDLIVLDENTDGLIDAFLTKSITGSGAIIAMFATPAGFGSPATIPVGSLPNGIAAGDFDHNGRLDLATANFDSDTVSIVYASNSGSFQSPAVSVRVGAGPNGIVVSDFTGDGNSDIATVNYFSFNCSLLVDQRTAPSNTGSFGNGTPGCHGRMGITCNAAPQANVPGFAIYITNGPANTLGTLLMGDAGDFGGINDPSLDVLLHVSPVSTHIVKIPFVINNSGQGTVPVPGVAPPTLVGFVFFAQAIVAWSPGDLCDPSTTGWSSSRGMHFTVQP